MNREIGIIGVGNVGSALKRGLERCGYLVRAVGKDPERVRETAALCDTVILAVPFAEVGAAVREMGDAVNGKVLVDATNAIGPDTKLALGFTTSGAEELQKKAPGAKVVKAFNTVFAKHLSTGKVKGTPLTLFVAGDDGGAKEQVLTLGRDLGFDPIDAGPLENARWLEAMGYLNIQLGYALKHGTDIGLRLIR